MGGKAAFSTNFRCSRSKNVKTQSQNSSFRPPKKAQNCPKYENRCSRSMFFRWFCLKGTVFTRFLKLFRPLIFNNRGSQIVKNGPFLAHFRGGLLGAILASFWLCFGRFWGAFLDPCFQESAPQRTRISLNRAQSRPNRFQFGPILPLLCPTQPKSLNQSQIRPNRPHISPNQPESATRAKHFQRKGRE